MQFKQDTLGNPQYCTWTTRFDIRYKKWLTLPKYYIKSKLKRPNIVTVLDLMENMSADSLFKSINVTHKIALQSLTLILKVFKNE